MAIGGAEQFVFRRQCAAYYIRCDFKCNLRLPIVFTRIVEIGKIKEFNNSDWDNEALNPVARQTIN